MSMDAAAGAPGADADLAPEESARLARLRRLLDGAGVPYRILAHESTVVTAQMGVERGFGRLEEMAPTLILQSERGLLAAIVSGQSRLSYRKIKKELGLKDVSFAGAETVRAATGAEVGTVSLVNEGLQTIVDARLAGVEAVFGGCGVPRHTLHIRTPDLIAVTGAQVFDFTAPRNDGAPPTAPAAPDGAGSRRPAAGAPVPRNR